MDDTTERDTIQVRKLATAAAVSLALASGGALGLGLGDIEMNSALNQPMDAFIELTSVLPAELDNIAVQLASPEAFARAGIERSEALSSLRFQVDTLNGQPVIRISSETPIVEPFLNFLLEVDWSQGRMVREFTVLLDPPVFMTPSATSGNRAGDLPALTLSGDDALVVPTPIERGSSSGGETVDLSGLGDTMTTPGATNGGERVSLDDLAGDGASQGEPAASAGQGSIVSLSDLNTPDPGVLSQARTAVIDGFEVEILGNTEETATDALVFDASGRAVIPGGPVEDGSSIVSLSDLDSGGASSEVRVERGDTLFQIAQDNNLSGVSVQQMMMAMLAVNESAFINRNINLVRAGSTLRVPDRPEATRLTPAEAIAAVNEQNQLWRDYRDSVRDGNATQLASSGASSQQPTSPAVDRREPIVTAEAGGVDSADGLSDEARAILEDARREILERDELRIVAGTVMGNTSASAVAESTQGDDEQRLAEINRRLQLAREELSSTQLQSEELIDQAGVLQSTTDNLDSLVNLRQNEIAELEASLAEMRDNADSAEGVVVDRINDVQSVISDAGDALGERVDGAVATGADALNATGAALTQTADAVGDELSRAGEGMGNAADDVSTNALSATGTTLEQVELLSESEAMGDTDISTLPPVPSPQSWWQSFLQDPRRLAIAAIGLIGLLGVLATLLLRRKRNDDADGDDTDLFNLDDEPEFRDSNKTQAKRFDVASDDDEFGSVAPAVAGAAAAGTMAAAAASHDTDDQSDDFSAMLNAKSEAMDSTYQDENDLSVGEVGDFTAALAAESSNDDFGDTLSEADVYLAYGLHGQAEELLVRAVANDPENPEYAFKLLQTYHAQGNTDSFGEAAALFHARFGGEQKPRSGPTIAAMGAELDSANELYAASSLGVTNSDDAIALGQESYSSSSFGDSPESSAGETASSEFYGDNDAMSASADADESHLMDESLDPAFAFDETDLEATGDFTAITDDLVNDEHSGSTDFAELVASSTDNMTEASHAALDSVQADTESLLSGASEQATSAFPGMSDELASLSASTDDLTLDLDQLSEDLELDNAGFVGDDMTTMDVAELTADNELSLADEFSFDSESLAGGENSDEMDTMLDLARAYIDMGDKDSASSALGEIVKSGNPEQVNEAQNLLRNIS